MLRALLTNIQQLSKNPPKRPGKEPYFDKQWGADAAFKKSHDRSFYALDSQGGASEINEQILVMHKVSRGSERNQFLSKMAVDSIDFIEEQRRKMAIARQEERLCQTSMAVMIEQIFEVLKSYAYELNSAVGYGPLHCAATNPQEVTEIVKFNKMRQAEETISYYRARLSTPSLSLVLRGDRSGIHFFVIPVSRAIGLSRQECQFLPAMRLKTRMINGEVSWETEHGCPLTSSMVEVICMNLFQRLIEETKSQVRTNNEENLSSQAVS
ncbi:MAG: hypothetical protein K2X27_08935 [Candidatus Obscuribacterales bacterium]|nr:hypothetical protein [Candidatus Obscuribacterales bacterium]